MRVSRIFRIFVPNFAPNVAPKFLRSFLRSFRAPFRGKRRPERINQTSPLFSMQNVQADSKKKSTKVFWRAGGETVPPLNDPFSTLNVECLQGPFPLENALENSHLKTRPFKRLLFIDPMRRDFKIVNRASEHAITAQIQGPLNEGVSNGGVSRSGLVLPFLSFFVLFGTFPTFREVSRFVRGLFGDFPDLSLFSFSAY